MWCIGRLTAEYRERMHALCELYGQAPNPAEPVVCVDEKSKQVLRSSRPELPARLGRCAKQDYEYVRRGTRNIFMAVEPLGGHRETSVTARRTKTDFVNFVCGLLAGTYAHVTKLHLVLDNLNTHFRTSFEEVLGAQADAVLARESFITPRNMPAGSISQNRSWVSWSGNAPLAALKAPPNSTPSCMRGSKSATPPRSP